MLLVHLEEEEVEKGGEGGGLDGGNGWGWI